MVTHGQAHAAAGQLLPLTLSCSCFRPSLKACAQECMHTCGAQKVQHAEYADERTISQVHASKVDESLLTSYEYKAPLH